MSSVSTAVKSALRQVGDVLSGRGRHSNEEWSVVAQRLSKALSGNATATADLDVLLNMHTDILSQAGLWQHVQKYNRDIAEVLGKPCPSPTYFLHTSWNYGTPYGDLLNSKLAEVFGPFEESLIEELHTKSIEGAIVEFGVYQGYMLGRLIEKAESLGMRNSFYGFDSFEGLSEPSKDYDYGEWEKGQYAAAYDLVAKNLRLSERPFLKLIKGWVDDSLVTPEAQAIKQVSYARIDVDIYDPTVTCLNYLSNRLVDGAILAFDDWAYTSEKGESKAFIDWSHTVPHLQFEWLGQCSSRFYLRVLHRDR
jgi:Macrocin-O-methyltransferase (TylF)